MPPQAKLSTYHTPAESEHVFNGSIQTDLYNALLRHYHGLSEQIHITITDTGWTLQSPEDTLHTHQVSSLTLNIPRSDWDSYRAPDNTPVQLAVNTKDTYKLLTSTSADTLDIHVGADADTPYILYNQTQYPETYHPSDIPSPIDVPDLQLSDVQYTLRAPYQLKQWMSGRSDQTLVLGVQPPARHNRFDGTAVVSFQPERYRVAREDTPEDVFSESEYVTFTTDGERRTRTREDVGEVSVSRTVLKRQTPALSWDEVPVLPMNDREAVWNRYLASDFYGLFKHQLKDHLTGAEYRFSFNPGFPVRIERCFDSVFDADASLEYFQAPVPVQSDE